MIFFKRVRKEGTDHDRQAWREGFMSLNDDGCAPLPDGRGSVGTLAKTATCRIARLGAAVKMSGSIPAVTGGAFHGVAFRGAAQAAPVAAGWNGPFSRGLISICLLVMMACGAMMAQGPGSIRGQVLDPSGAAVPKAIVTVTGPNNVVKVATTDNDGNYAIPGLPPGKYMVRIIATGFAMLEKPGVDVAGGRPLTLDVKLTVETSKQEVTVSDTQQVELDPAKNAGALVLKAEDLDMLSDDPDDLQADLLALAGPSAGPNGGQIFIDGFSNGQLPPKESIREIRINANPFSAEYDTQGRGRIEIFTKPGTEKFHGTVNVNYGTHLFNARNPFITSPDFAVPAADTKNLQANLSGPIIKRKMSFFVDFARRQQRLDALINAVVLNNAFAPVPEGFAIIAPNTFNSISPRVTYQLSPNISLDGRYSFHGQSFENQGVG